MKSYLHKSIPRREAHSKWAHINILSIISHAAAAAAKSLQSCPTLCNPIDGSPPGSPVPGILQARTLEWVVISFSNAWKWKVKVKLLSRVRLFGTPWTAAYQAPPPWDFPGKSTAWGGVPLSSPNSSWETCISKPQLDTTKYLLNWLKKCLNLTIPSSEKDVEQPPKIIHCWWK